MGDGQLAKHTEDDGKTESSMENMQTALNKVVQIRELMECMCLSCAGKPFTHRWCNGTDFPLRASDMRVPFSRNHAPPLESR